MSALLTVSTRLTDRWVDFYTRGLPDPERAERKAKIESDLWEHRQDGIDTQTAPNDTGFEIIVRLLCGIPADLLWRRTVALRSAGIGSRRAGVPITKGGLAVARKVIVAVISSLTVLLGLFILVNGLGSAWGHQDLYMWVFAAGSGLAGLMLIGGTRIFGRSPRAGTGLVIAGAVVGTLNQFWMLGIGVPIALVVIAGAVLRFKNQASARPSVS